MCESDHTKTGRVISKRPKNQEKIHRCFHPEMLLKLRAMYGRRENPGFRSEVLFRLFVPLASGLLRKTEGLRNLPRTQSEVTMSEWTQCRLIAFLPLQMVIC